jgi:hypothetical protein
MRWLNRTGAPGHAEGPAASRCAGRDGAWANAAKASVEKSSAGLCGSLESRTGTTPPAAVPGARSTRARSGVLSIGTTPTSADATSRCFPEAVKGLGLVVRPDKPRPMDGDGHGVRVGLVSAGRLDRVPVLLGNCCRRLVLLRLRFRGSANRAAVVAGVKSASSANVAVRSRV